MFVLARCLHLSQISSIFYRTASFHDTLGLLGGWRDFHPNPFVIRRGGGETARQFRVIACGSQINPRRRGRRSSFLRIKAVPRSLPLNRPVSCFLKPEFIVCSPLLIRPPPPHPPISPSRAGEFNRSLSCFAATGKTSRFLSS